MCAFTRSPWPTPSVRLRVRGTGLCSSGITFSGAVELHPVLLAWAGLTFDIQNQSSSISTSSCGWMQCDPDSNVPSSNVKPSQKRWGCYCSKGGTNSPFIPWFPLISEEMMDGQTSTHFWTWSVPKYYFCIAQLSYLVLPCSQQIPSWWSGVQEVKTKVHVGGWYTSASVQHMCGKRTW